MDGDIMEREESPNSMKTTTIATAPIVNIINNFQNANFLDFFNFLYSSPFCSFYLLMMQGMGTGQFSDHKKLLFNYLKNNNQIFFPVNLAPERSFIEQNTEIQESDYVYQKIKRIFVERGNNFRIQDFCNLGTPVQHQTTEEDQFIPIVSPEDSLRIARYCDINPGIIPSDVFSRISNVPEGTATHEHEGGYVKINYSQSGLPICSGSKDNDSNILNLYWKVLEKPCSNMPNQVSEEMEALEDESNDIDVQLVRCQNVLKLLTTNPGLVLSTQAVETELREIYGKEYASLMVELFLLSGDETYHSIINRVRERCVKLFQTKLKTLMKYSTNLSHELPIQQSKYQEPVKLNYSSTIFSSVGSSPILFSISDTKYLKNIYDHYWNLHVFDMTSKSEDKEKCKEKFNEIMSIFRKENNKSFPVTYEKATVFASAAVLLSYITTYNINKYNYQHGIRTAMEIGVASQNNQGEERFSYLVGKALTEHYKDRKNTIYELAGTFTKCDITAAQMIIEAAHFFIRTIKLYASRNNDINIIQVNIIPDQTKSNLSRMILLKILPPHDPIWINLNKLE